MIFRGVALKKKSEIRLNYENSHPCHIGVEVLKSGKRLLLDTPTEVRSTNFQSFQENALFEMNY